jgi:branched-chain amino acid transport system permease protein
VIGSVGFHLILRVGLVSLGHAAFAGVGGYTSVILMMSFGLPWIVCFVAGGLAAAAVALLVGPIVLRLRGVYFVLITFTLGEIVRLIFNDWQSMTGGANGISHIPPPWPALLATVNYYYLALAAALIAVTFSARLLRSDFGRKMDAIRESESLAEANGIPVFAIKVTVFAIGCTLAGLQGSLQAHFIRLISPLAYSFQESLNFLVMNVVGGSNSLAGPIVGTVFLVALPEFLRGWVEYQFILYGLILIVVMAALPGGLVELWQRLSYRLASLSTGGDR